MRYHGGSIFENHGQTCQYLFKVSESVQLIDHRWMVRDKVHAITANTKRIIKGCHQMIKFLAPVSAVDNVSLKPCYDNLRYKS